MTFQIIFHIYRTHINLITDYSRTFIEQKYPIKGSMHTDIIGHQKVRCLKVYSVHVAQTMNRNRWSLCNAWLLFNRSFQSKRKLFSSEILLAKKRTKKCSTCTTASLKCILLIRISYIVNIERIWSHCFSWINIWLKIFPSIFFGFCKNVSRQHLIRNCAFSM